jgi:hypothetical protein
MQRLRYSEGERYMVHEVTGCKGELVRVPGELLLRHGRASRRFPKLRLEVLPNRDSLQYRELYGVPHVHSICRGTLRYEGDDDVDVEAVVLCC